MDRKVKIVKKRTKFHRKHKNKDAKHSDNKNKDIKFNLATFQQKHYMEMYNQCKNQHFNTIEDLRLQAVEFLEHRNIKDCLNMLDKIIMYAKASYDSILYLKTNITAAKLCMSENSYGNQDVDYGRA